MYKRFACLAVIACFLFPAVVGAELIDRVVAVVNDDLITLSDLNRDGEIFFQKIKANTLAPDLEKAMHKARQDVLASLIDKTIVSQKATELSISVSENEIDEAIKSIMARNRVSEKIFKKDLAAMGETEESYRRTIREQILQSKLVNFEVRAKIVVTEERVKEYYDTHYSQETTSPGYHIFQMGFSWNNPAKSSTVGKADEKTAKIEAKKRAEKARELVLTDGEFIEIAKTHSELPSAADGGDLGMFKKDEMAPYMREAILPLSPGEVSPVVETPSGYQFFKLTATEENMNSFAALKEKIHAELYQKELKKQYEKWVQELRTQAYVKNLL